MHQLNAMGKKSLPSHIRNYRHGNIRVYNYIVTVMTVTVIIINNNMGAYIALLK